MVKSDRSPLHFVLCTLDFDWSPLHFVLCTLDSDWSLLHFVLCTLVSDWSPLDFVLCTLDSDWSSFHFVLCTLDSSSLITRSFRYNFMCTMWEKLSVYPFEKSLLEPMSKEKTLGPQYQGAFQRGKICQLPLWHWFHSSLLHELSLWGRGPWECCETPGCVAQFPACY
jgi:hypothetical protein